LETFWKRGARACTHAVNVAARVEHAAQPGEILIGAETLALAPAALDPEPIEPLELKGRTTDT
jgi:class 3 adenylate cyclase